MEADRHRQLGICTSTESALGIAMLGDTYDYAAMVTPVMSVQVANARVRSDRMFAAVSWSRRRGKKIGDLVMDGKEALNLSRGLEPLHDPLSSSGRLMGKRPV